MDAKIYCLMTNCGSLTDEGRTLLSRTASKMWQQQKVRQKIKTGELEGMVTTRGKFASLGTIVGIEFTAEVDYGARTFKTRFIVRVTNLEEFDEEDSVWVPVMPTAKICSRNQLGTNPVNAAFWGRETFEVLSASFFYFSESLIG